MLDKLFSSTYSGSFFSQGNKALSYPAFYKAARSLAAALSCHGDEPVVIRCISSPLAAVCIAACLLCGRPYIPLSPAIPLSRFISVWDITRAALLLCPETKQPSLGDPSSAWYAGHIQRLCGLNLPFEAGEIDPLAPAAYFFTSGTSGKPKGVAVLRENIEHFTTWFISQPVFHKAPPRVILGQAGFFFDLSDAHFFPALFWGARVVVPHTGKDFASLFEIFRQSGAELAVWTPSYAALCMCDPSFNQTLLPGLRCIWFCGEPLTASVAQKLYRRFPHTHIINAYGPTEATCAVCSAEITPLMAASGQPLPVGAVQKSAAFFTFTPNGELCLSGSSVAGGYLNGGSRAFSLENGIRRYATGDFAHIKNGLLYLDGRQDSQFKYLGYRIEAQEIEQALCTLSGVDMAAVLPLRGADGQVQKICALIAGDKTPKELRIHLSTLLPDYMIPSVFKTVSCLPLTANGKLDRAALERRYSADAEAGS